MVLLGASRGLSSFWALLDRIKGHWRAGFHALDLWRWKKNPEGEAKGDMSPDVDQRLDELSLKGSTEEVGLSAGIRIADWEPRKEYIYLFLGGIHHGIGRYLKVEGAPHSRQAVDRDFSFPARAKWKRCWPSAPRDR